MTTVDGWDRHRPHPKAFGGTVPRKHSGLAKSEKEHKPVLIRGATYAKCSACGDLASYNSTTHDYGVVNPNGCGAVFTATIDIGGPSG